MILSGIFAAPPAAETSLACSACHKEHHGKESDLKQLSNLQCQTCHAAQFASFESGHPDFAGYPFMRRTRIIFDHNSHLKTHFLEERFRKSAPKSCTDCHIADERGRMMVVTSFDTSCAACHGDQIQGKGRAGTPGIAFLRLPGLDIETLKEKNLPLGDWPEFAEGRLTPFMELLLADQPDVQASIDRLRKVDLLDLIDADEATLKAAHKVGWAVKGLFFDLQSKGQGEILRRVQAGLTAPLDPAEVSRMTGLLSPDVINGAVRQWFPNLAAEVTAQRSREKLPAAGKANPVPATKGVKPEEWVESGGWYRSDLDYSIAYRPHGHADDFLSSWLTLTVNHKSYRLPEAAQRLFEELASPKSPGMCAKCHSVDRVPQPAINWHVARPNPQHHAFTQFSHTAHFSLLDDRGCMTCHSRDTTADYLTAFEKNSTGDPGMYHSNFKPIQKSLCASCHTPNFAGDSCLLCHSYHIGTFTSTVSVSSKASTGFARGKRGP